MEREQQQQQQQQEEQEQRQEKLRRDIYKYNEGVSFRHTHHMRR